MNYYIDFDNTLYKTSDLVKDMLDQLAKDICQYTNEDINVITEKLNKSFNKDNIYNIYELVEHFATEYNIKASSMIENVEKIILDGEKYVYEDTIDFLKLLAENGNQIYILTYVAKEDISYQLSKIKGSGLAKYVDNIIITSHSKSDLDLEYKNGIFIDDNVENLMNLYKRDPKMLIRMKRKNNKHSLESICMNINKIIEIESFKDFNFKFD